MRKYVIALVLFFTVSNLKAQTPIEFNDRLVAITDSLFKQGQAWGQKFNEVVTTKTFENLAKENQQLEKFVDRNILTLTRMKDVAGSENLRKSMLEFLRFEKDMITKAFRPFEKLTAKSTNEEIQKALENLKLQSANETTVLQKVNEQQELYAEKNGFSIAKE